MCKALTSQKTLFLAPRPAVALGEQTLWDLELRVIGELQESPRALVLLLDMCLHIRPVWAGQPSR